MAPVKPAGHYTQSSAVVIRTKICWPEAERWKRISVTGARDGLGSDGHSLFIAEMEIKILRFDGFFNTARDDRVSVWS